jgi:signal transduction histidine kinase
MRPSAAALSRLDGVIVSRRWRERAGMGAVGAVAVAGAVAAPVFGALTTLPAAIAVAGMVGVLIAWPYGRRRLIAVTGAAGVVSLVATAGVLWSGEMYGQGHVPSTLLALTETAGLLGLTVLVVRTAPIREAVPVAGIAGVAVPAQLLRFGPLDVSAATLGGFGAWSLPALLAAAVGLYLRSLDDRRTRTVLEARRAQRLQLARDLHDFVAHDVSEVLAQAQAGEILTAQDPDGAATAFRHIQQAALRALASMDRTVHMLHAADSPAGAPAQDSIRAPQPTLADLPDVADRFSASGTAAVHLDIDAELRQPELTDARPARTVPREVATTVYRVAVEALTNVRRHAPAASRVRIVVRRTRDTGGVAGPAIEISVTNDGTSWRDAAQMPPQRKDDWAADRHGGYGLPGLAERAEALGGTLTAGPETPSGWRVAAVLPLTPAPARSGTGW